MELPTFVWVIIKAAVLAGVLLSISNLAVLGERKVSSWIQGRVGPNRTSVPIIGSIPVIGPMLTRLGLFQPVADGLKLLLKEDPVPDHVNKFYFFLAPVAAMVPAVTTVAVLPFGQIITDGVTVPLVLADIDIGMLFIFAVSSLGVYGMILAGWASNSKYPFIGGIRSSAQMISYELSMGLSILPVFMWANAPGVDSGLNLFSVVQTQQGAWGVLFMPVAALLFLVSIFAETNRLPFDMPESESELVAGFSTEYGSFKFGLFFAAEYAHIIVGSGVFVVLFLGGWHWLPWVPMHVEGLLGAALSIGVFLAKTIFIVFLFMWIRWTLPRFRYDQIMKLGWTMMLPLAVVNLIVYALIFALLDS
ncbi:NADH-quinone oxidoreductase subunit H [Opitutia bacterium ISCC 51]|nr:NADH-quinone oxidoreductase subunit H [Opitutae bacterium ISCC 51]QXD28980.1 NADH-quinone oxidoreductase subunit H [Opitutae bacterium ISCC 52]